MQTFGLLLNYSIVSHTSLANNIGTEYYCTLTFCFNMFMTRTVRVISTISIPELGINSNQYIRTSQSLTFCTLEKLDLLKTMFNNWVHINFCFFLTVLSPILTSLHELQVLIQAALCYSRIIMNQQMHAGVRVTCTYRHNV